MNEFFNLTDVGERIVAGKVLVPDLAEPEVKSYKGWGEQRCTLDKYVKVGDRVDQEMANYFLNVMPPATASRSLIQIGEPNSHVGGRPTFATLRMEEGGWVYAGNCFKGERQTGDGSSENSRKVGPSLKLPKEGGGLKALAA